VYTAVLAAYLSEKKMGQNDVREIGLPLFGPRSLDRWLVIFIEEILGNVKQLVVSLWRYSDAMLDH
jgi:hypothetical protein